jgi:DNA-binding MarR family transcriptional regulator
MTQSKNLRLAGFVPYRLSVLANTVSTAIAGAYAQRFGLSIPEWRVIAVLAERPNLSAAEVAAQTAMDKVAVSRAVASLLRDKRLQRRMARADRRRSVLRLSVAGERVYSEVVPFALAYEKALLEPLDSADRVTLDKLLRVLLARAEELGPLHAS